MALHESVCLDARYNACYIDVGGGDTQMHVGTPDVKRRVGNIG